MTRAPRRLDRVLRVREVEEDVARGAWAIAEAEAAAARERTLMLQAQHVSSEQDLARRMAEGDVSPAAALCAHRALDHIGQEIEAARVAERDAEGRAEEARTPWEDKRREKRGLEILVERDRMSRLEEARTEEAAAIDEVAIQRAARKQPDPRKDTA